MSNDREFLPQYSFDFLHYFAFLLRIRLISLVSQLKTAVKLDWKVGVFLLLKFPNLKTKNNYFQYFDSSFGFRIGIWIKNDPP